MVLERGCIPLMADPLERGLTVGQIYNIYVQYLYEQPTKYIYISIPMIIFNDILMAHNHMNS